MKQSRNYMKNITELNLSGYKFILYYVEELNQGIAEFPHHHHPYQIYYVLDGSIEINIVGRLEKIPQYSCLFLSHNIKHHVTYTPDIEKRYFTVIFDVIPHQQDMMNGPDGIHEYQDIVKALEICDSSGYYISKEPIRLEHILNLLYEEIREKKVGWNTLAVIYCYQFFLKAIRCVSQAPVTDLEFSGKENLAMAASMYIHANYQKEISVESAAESLNVSPRHVNRSYQSMFGTTFIKNTNLLRIAYAKDYLCMSNDSLEEISEKVGFVSPRTFYKLFHQYEGLSPAQYRTLHKE